MMKSMEEARITKLLSKVWEEFMDGRIDKEGTKKMIT